MIPDRFQGYTVRIGKVVDTYPRAGAVDIVLFDNLAQLRMVQVLSPSAWTDGGTANLPQVTVREGAERWSVKLTGERDMLAVVLMSDVMPLVVGFLPPQVNQIAFDKSTHPDLFIERHASDLVRYSDAQGNMRILHPGGTEITIGTPPDLPGQDYDGKFALSRNTGHHPQIVLRAGASVITVFSGGDITIDAAGDVIVRGNTIQLN